MQTSKENAMNMLNMTMVPVNPPNPFNPPIGRVPLIFKAVWISNPPNFTIIDGPALERPEQWATPTQGLLVEMVHLAIDCVYSWHEREPELSIHCTQEASETLSDLSSRINITACIPKSNDGINDCFISAKCFHAKTIIIRYLEAKQ